MQGVTHESLVHVTTHYQLALDCLEGTGLLTLLVVGFCWVGKKRWHLLLFHKVGIQPQINQSIKYTMPTCQLANQLYCANRRCFPIERCGSLPWTMPYNIYPPKKEEAIYLLLPVPQNKTQKFKIEINICDNKIINITDWSEKIEMITEIMIKYQ